MFAFPPLVYAFLVPGCPMESVSLPLAGTCGLSDCWPDFRLSASMQPPMCSHSFPMSLRSQPPYVHTPGLTPKHRTHLEREEPILFLLQVQTWRALETGWPLGPEGDFRTPMANVNVPRTVLAPGPLPFPAPLRASEATPEHFQRAVSDSWRIRTRSERLAESRSWAKPLAAFLVRWTLGFATFMDEALPTVETMSLFSTPVTAIG